MKIIIPMSGSGRRFLNAGYPDIKPLIKINNKPIIEYVLKMFTAGDNFIFICNENHLKNTPLKETLLTLAPKGEILSIPEHKKGPVYTVNCIVDIINNDEPYLISYCDYFMGWDYKEFKKQAIKLKFDGAVPSYTGFHPHLLGPDKYAGCRVDKNNFLLEIKEKHSFTENKMDSYHSAGAYYFKKGSYIKKYFKELLARNINTNGEYYISMVYGLMLEDKLKIFIPVVKYFCQWGTPADLEEYKYWESYFHGK